MTVVDAATLDALLDEHARSRPDAAALVLPRPGLGVFESRLGERATQRVTFAELAAPGRRRRRRAARRRASVRARAPRCSCPRPPTSS